jgi:hypothetical protein
MTEAEARAGPLPPSPGRAAVPPFRRFYEPDSIRVMSDALELVCRLLPAAARDNESLRRRLALHIMHGLDAGDRDAMRLAMGAALWVRV